MPHSVMLPVTKSKYVHHHSLLRGTIPSLSLKLPKLHSGQRLGQHIRNLYRNLHSSLLHPITDMLSPSSVTLRFYTHHHGGKINGVVHLLRRSKIAYTICTIYLFLLSIPHFHTPAGEL
jgi:hypothetical protein